MTPARVMPLLLLAGYGIAFASVAFGLAVPGHDDHPGQLYRLQHMITRGPAPWAWNPGWWGGYAELQFYPPGFFYLGALPVWASLGALSAESMYRALLWITFLAPAVTSFIVLARLLSSEWLALPGAFIALTLNGGLLTGVEGVHYGTLPTRLAWALLPLLILTLGRWINGSHRSPWETALLLAAVTLIHPAQGPAAVALVAVAAWSAVGRPARRVSSALAILGLAGLMTAFWTLPLLARLGSARALAVSQLAPLQQLTTYPLLALLLGLAALGVGIARTRLERTVARWPWAAFALVLVDAAVLEPLGISWLPADRIADGAWLALTLAAGWVIGRGLQRLLVRLPAPVLALGALALIVALGLPGPALALWPQPREWPSLQSVDAGLRLQALWTTLRQAPEGRVLFLRSAVPLVHGTEWWRPHTHVTALTPLYAGRTILGGTFTHPSPFAALLYRGDAGPGAITRFAERLDGHEAFGQPLEALEPDTIAAYVDRLGVSVIVALDEDAPRLRALESPSLVSRRTTVGPFWIYELNARRIPTPAGSGRWIFFTPAEGEGWVPARMTYSPLWRAARQGTPLQTRRGPDWSLEIRLDGVPGPVTLKYAGGIPEHAGVVVSALAAAAWSLLMWRRRVGS
ncbi:MAG TPA: hypothetical protein VID04_17340 [Methylomirabilota bacterium]